MTNVLILLTLTDAVRQQYHARLQARFPEVSMTLVDHHTKAGPYIGDADAMVTFAPMLSPKVLEAATRLKWVQALGTGTDNLTDQPALRKDVIVTNIHGIHGPPVSEAALATMLALARNLPRRRARPGRARMAALAGAASAQQDGGDFRRRRHRRISGAEMQGLRHARRRRQFGRAAGRRLRPGAIPATSYPGSPASSTSSCC